MEASGRFARQYSARFPVRNHSLFAQGDAAPAAQLAVAAVAVWRDHEPAAEGPRQADVMTMRNLVFAILSIVAISCTTERPHDGEGSSYAVKVMSDGRTWTTENLRLALPGSYCHGDATSECLRVGRLYTWATAVEACGRLGASWRLPTDDEWRQLARAYGGTLGDSDGRAALTALVAGGPSGFNAVLGGNREPGGSYARLDEHGFYWTATESDKEHALFYNFGRGGGSLNRHQGGDKSMAVSVRCVGTR